MSNAIQHDKREWLLAVLDRYEKPLTRYATRLTGDVGRAQDAVQETFLALISDGAPRDDTRVAQWLYTVCRNRTLDARRKDRKMTIITEHTARGQAAEEATPADGAENRETAGRVVSFLHQLPQRQQEIIVLRFQDCLSYREIAGVLNISVANVGFVIHTAIKTLRRQLCPPAEAEPDRQRSRS